MLTQLATMCEPLLINNEKSPPPLPYLCSTKVYTDCSVDLSMGKGHEVGQGEEQGEGLSSPYSTGQTGEKDGVRENLFLKVVEQTAL